MATTQETEWSEAIQPYLAPGESVEYSYEETSGDLEASTGFYALTDRRLIELSQEVPDDADQLVNFEAYPLEDASAIQVSREETEGGLDDEYGLAGVISGIAGVFLLFLPFPSEIRTFSMLAGGFFLVLGLVLFLLALGSSSGVIRLSLSGETDSKVIALPLDGEDFAQTVARAVGGRQS